MKSAREAGHAIANEWDAACLLDQVLGWSHGPRCDTATAAIEARDREHAAERNEAVDLLRLMQRAAADNHCGLRVVDEFLARLDAPAVAPGPGEGPMRLAEAEDLLRAWQRSAGCDPTNGMVDADTTTFLTPPKIRECAAAPPVAPAPVPRPPALPLPWNGTGPEFNEAPAVGRPVAPAETPPPEPLAQLIVEAAKRGGSAPRDWRERSLSAPATPPVAPPTCKAWCGLTLGDAMKAAHEKHPSEGGLRNPKGLSRADGSVQVFCTTECRKRFAHLAHVFRDDGRGDCSVCGEGPAALIHAKPRSPDVGTEEGT